MKADTRAHLDRASEFLVRADGALIQMTQQPLMAADAARNAYYAAFHAAKALIFERTGGNSRKHGSVHRAFKDVTLNDPLVDSALRGFLVKSYDYKRSGDYETGPAALVNTTDARDDVTEAKRFVSVVAALLP